VLTSHKLAVHNHVPSTSSSAIAERPCDCCVGQFWPKGDIINHCDAIGLQSYQIW